MEQENSRLPRILLFAAIAGLFLIVLVERLSHSVAQDALAYSVAGELAWRGHPHIYDHGADNPAFEQRFCQLVPPDRPCNKVVVPFVSPPMGLVLSALLGSMGAERAVLAFQLLGAICLGLIFYSVHQRCEGETKLGAGIACLTLLPFAMYVLELGQSTPWLAAAALIGKTDSKDENPLKSSVLGALIAGCTAFKLWPGFTLAVLAWKRDWIAIGVAIGCVVLLVALGVWMFPASIYQEASNAISEFGVMSARLPYNISVPAVLNRAGIPGAVYFRIPLGLLLFGPLLSRKLSPTHVQMLMVSAFTLLSPIVWWHYLWVPVGVWFSLVAPLANTLTRRYAMICVLLFPSVFLSGVSHHDNLTLALGSVYALGLHLSAAALARHQ